jgi:hypothetical protein
MEHLKTQMELSLLQGKIEISLTGYQVQLERLKEERETENDEHAIKVLDQWIWLNEKRIELLTDLNKK